MKWRIYYADGSTRDHNEGLPHPTNDYEAHHGTQCILQERGDGNLHIVHGHDYYIFGVDGCWLPMDWNILEDILIHHRSDVQCVLKGRAISYLRFRELWKQVQEDKRTENLG